MAGTYTTIQGDTWDLIAYRLYGAEKYMRYLFEANWPQADVLVFPSGTVLNVPDPPEEVDEDAPFWRQEAGGADSATYSPVEEDGDEE